MFRKTAYALGGFVWLILVILYAPNTQQTAFAQTPATTSKETTAAKKFSAPKMTNGQKIALAVTAGPAEITKNATIVDMTDMHEEPKQLRAGTNGWVCYASATQPMCLDKQWQKWMEALMSKSEPQIEGTGIAYMLRGDKGASNTDPYATEPTADNQWVVSPAHLMVLVQDRRTLDEYSTDPRNGGPWVMWKGTPYAHLMVPVSPTKAATMSSK